MERKVTLVQDFELPSEREEESRKVIVFDERLSHVVNLTAFILRSRVCEENNLLRKDSIWREVDKRAVRSTPDGVKLGFDEDARPLPERPAGDHGSALGRDLLLDDGKALPLRPIKPRPMRYCLGARARRDFAGEGGNVFCVDERDGVHCDA